MGRTTGNGWFYVPDYGEHGPAAHAAFSEALDAADELLGTMDLAPAHKHATLWASDGSPQAVWVDAEGNVGIGLAPPLALAKLFVHVGTETNFLVGDSFGGAGEHAVLLDAVIDSGGTLIPIYYNASRHVFWNGNITLGLGPNLCGASADKVIGIGTGTAPTTAPADMVQLFSKDVAAGYATLHKRTETCNQDEIVVGCIYKTDTGDPANPYEGLMTINTADNKVKIYADGAWQQLATW